MMELLELTVSFAPFPAFPAKKAKWQNTLLIV